MCVAVVLPEENREKGKQVRRSVGELIKQHCSALNLFTRECAGPSFGFLPSQPATLAFAYTCHQLPPTSKLEGRTLLDQLKTLAAQVLDSQCKAYPGVLIAVAVAKPEKGGMCFLGCSSRRQTVDLPRESWDRGQPNEAWGVRLMLSALARGEQALLGEDFPQSFQATLDERLPEVAGSGPARPRF